MQPHRQLPLQRSLFRRTLLPDTGCLPNDVGFPPNHSQSSRLDSQIPYSAAFVIGRNTFLDNSQTADLGKYAFGFMWAAMTCLLLATILFCVAGVTSKRDSTYTRKTGGRTFFGRKKSTRKRGSFIDSESQRRVKDEYN